ncbi:hypothetical protein H257_16944 [Aphanomyces astaci]|uniref:Uncharacterized protein n=1 Tax=Aphanomyces astaci TaxID=112090 RepID=W4FIU0_APHAT|nr:hypothetical protein H257_16944 [Aphanomyces astaci]ETV66638.1 hypothetical protein H257_16944 [Aphanomyces astaci]|eukprot:XP_009843866.1 hypothetical protein H257_16944 [Aphanomyces astaci]
MEREKYGNVMGGKLSLKGLPLSKKSKKKRKREHAEETEEKSDVVKKQETEVLVPIAAMTPAQKKHQKFKAKREEEDIKKQASKTYRERVDEYSQYLGNLSEHHDVPRVSAAGNG